jgi:hypothetical protein
VPAPQRLLGTTSFPEHLSSWSVTLKYTEKVRAGKGETRSITIVLESWGTAKQEIQVHFNSYHSQNMPL